MKFETLEVIMFVRVGIKRRHLKVPEGYEIIKEGIVQKNDMFACQVNSPYWHMMEADDISCNVKHYDCVIRPIKKS